MRKVYQKEKLMEDITAGGGFSSNISNVQFNDVGFVYSVNYKHSGCLELQK